MYPVAGERIRHVDAGAQEPVDVQVLDRVVVIELQPVTGRLLGTVEDDYGTVRVGVAGEGDLVEPSIVMFWLRTGNWLSGWIVNTPLA